MKKLTFTQKYIARHFLMITKPGYEISKSLDDIKDYEYRNYSAPLKWPTEKDYEIAKKYAQSILDKAYKEVTKIEKRLEKAIRDGYDKESLKEKNQK